MDHTFDYLLRASGIFFLPWIGSNYNEGYRGRKFLVLGESHYTDWGGKRHQLGETFTRDCVCEITRHEGGNRLLRNIEQSLLHQTRQNGRCRGDGLDFWGQLAFYNYVQSGVLGGPRTRPSDQQFIDSLAPFEIVLRELRPARILVCGKRLWEQMDNTKVKLHPDIQAYELPGGVQAWCLAINHPSSSRFSWRKISPVIEAFLRDPQEAVELLSGTVGGPSKVPTAA